MMPAVEEIATTSPERWARITGSTARVTFSGPNKVVSSCARKSCGLISSNSPVCRLGVGGVGDVELDGQQVVVLAQGRCDSAGVTPGGDHGVTGRERGPGDVGAHAAAGAGDEPDLLVLHVSHR